MFANSCDDAFIKMIEKKYKTLDKFEQGRITYSKIAFYEMFNMINVVNIYLHDLIKNFSKNGIATVPNKNISALN